VAGRFLRILRRARGYLLFGRKVEILGPFTVVHPRGVRFGKNCAINHGVFLHGGYGITLGDNVVLSAGCMILDGQLDPAAFRDDPRRDYRNEPITIEADAWIGAEAIVLGGVTVGTLAVVGAGSVVTEDVAPRTVVAGNPAKPIRTLDDK
jgi:acetyltransferase-like isoleucine patch superfamily enzyme